MQKESCCADLQQLLKRRPDACAVLTGSQNYPNIRGTVRFYGTGGGVVVCADVRGLPDGHNSCEGTIVAFHIHQGGNCGGNAEDPFADVGGHYDTRGNPHPCHMGDMPPLWVAGGRALSVFLTNRFTVREIIGRTVIIHRFPDDLMTQPSGNAREKIACGVIK